MNMGFRFSNEDLSVLRSLYSLNLAYGELKNAESFLYLLKVCENKNNEN